GKVRPAQKVRVAANQAWFEYQPARVEKSNPKVDRFDPPQVNNAVIDQYDEAGLGLEQGNLAAIQSLKIFRSLRYGKNVDLIITDNHSFRSEPVSDLAEVAQFQPETLPLFFPFDALEILDAGRAYNNNHPPETIEYDGRQIPNPRKNAPPKSVLGTKQKAWFKERLRASSAPWKLWGNSFAMLDWRLDLQNLPADFKLRWPSKSFGTLGGDWTTYRTERNEILDYIKQEKITSLVTVVGDRHSFFAGLLSASLPPNNFQPVAAEFITGSVSAPGLVEAMSYRIPKDDPQRPLFFYQPSNAADAQPSFNFSILNGVRSSLMLQQTCDVKKALSVRNSDVSPHLSFVDMGGHGYSRVRVTQDDLDVEFVCLPRPLERSDTPDGGPLKYRVAHRLKHWKPGESPRLERTKLEGDIPVLF
ncbi:MAG TPA: alkaline phosphatase D family protein, partial [Acidobacteriota bacterium]|nr:alkaline phosphatase D family protein [Acidobacteriota bacterium]